MTRTVIDETLRTIRTDFGLDTVAAYLRDAEQGALRLAGLQSARGAAPAGAREYPWGRGLVGRAAERAEPIAATDPDAYTLAAPMVLGDDAAGVLAVARARPLTAAETDGLLARGRALARALAPAPLDALRAELAPRLSEGPRAWLDALLAAAQRGDREAIVNAFPGVSRRVGREPLGSRSALVRRDLDVEVPLRAWRMDDAARAAVLCAYAQFEPSGAGEISREPAARRDPSQFEPSGAGEISREPAARRDPSQSEPSGAGETAVRAAAEGEASRRIREERSGEPAARRDPSQSATELARELYFTGDLRERSGALRGLAVIGRGDGALDAVLDAGRVTAVELFEAVIAENPYASRVLPDEEFRKLVLKSAFVGVSLDRVIGLETRADAELSRMLLSYVTEREVAGRSVPPDVWPIVARYGSPGLAAKLCGYLEHPAEAHRAAAARALGHLADPRARPFLEDRLARETDPAVRRALERAIA
jgi:hypothetical protein